MPTPLQAQQPDEPSTTGVRFVMRKHPSLRTRNLRLDLTWKSQGDWRDYAPDPALTHEAFELHRARVGVQGTFRERFEFQIEGELRDRCAEIVPCTKDPWRDVWGNVRIARGVQVRAGQFKIPFSLEQLTGSSDIDFTYRSLAATYLAPGRDVGVMVHGSVRPVEVRYQVGVFRRGGENVRASERSDPQSERTIAGRVTIRPWDRRGVSRKLRPLQFGAAFTSGHVPEGLNSLRGRTVTDVALFRKVTVNGERRRIGFEMNWTAGRGSLKSEFIRVRDERLGQGTDDNDLPAAVASGWYVSGSWLVTRDSKQEDLEPNRPLLRGGFGAVEVAARIDAFRLGSSDSTRPASRSVRAANMLEHGDQVWTFGVNWYLNRFVRVQVNAIRERRLEGETAIPGQDGVWSRVIRLQFVL
jgi:phosphate-selective porin OprO/OprP